MAYGIQISNTSGTIIISEDYRNYHVVSEGTIANDTALSLPSGTSIVGVRPAGAVAGSTVRLGANGGYASSTGSVEYAIMMESPSPSADAYGFRVLRADGSVAFDSGRKIMRPVGMHRKTSVWLDTTGANVTYPAVTMATRKRYVAGSCFAITGLMEHPNPNLGVFYGTTVTFNGDTSFNVADGYIGIGPRPNTGGEYWGTSVLISFFDA